MRRLELKELFRLGAGAILGVVLAAPAPAAILLVGPAEVYKTPCAAIAAASPGDVIEIAPVLYKNDSCAWQPNNLSLIGMIGPNGTRPHIDDAGMTGENGEPHLAQYKGIWVPYGNNTVVENIEFSGAQIPVEDGNNGAGIRISGKILPSRTATFITIRTEFWRATLPEATSTSNFQSLRTMEQATGSPTIFTLGVWLR